MSQDFCSCHLPTASHVTSCFSESLKLSWQLSSITGSPPTYGSTCSLTPYPTGWERNLLLPHHCFLVFRTLELSSFSGIDCTLNVLFSIVRNSKELGPVMSNVNPLTTLPTAWTLLSPRTAVPAALEKGFPVLNGETSVDLTGLVLKVGVESSTALTYFILLFSSWQKGGSTVIFNHCALMWFWISWDSFLSVFSWNKYGFGYCETVSCLFFYETVCMDS